MAGHDLLDLTLLQPIHIDVDAIYNQQYLATGTVTTMGTRARWSRAAGLQQRLLTFAQTARGSEFHF